MTKRTRTILFLILTLLFFLIAPSIVLYSQGWRFDPETKKVVKIGGFYFRVSPKRADVFIDGKSYKTDYFFGSLFVEGLLPGEYQVKIEKEGFLPWKKKLKVKEEETTKAENIFLIPKTVNFEILAKGIKNFIPSKEQEKMVFVIENKGWELKVLDLKQNLVAHLLEEKNIQEGAEFKEVIFSPTTREVLIKTESKKEAGYFLFNLDNTSWTFINFLNSLAKEISFSEDGKKLLFLSKNKLFEGGLEEKIPSSLLENVVCYELKEGFIYYLDKSGFLFKTDLKGERKEKLTEEALEIQEKNYEIYVASPFVFLKEGNSLFLLDEKEKYFQKFSDSVKGIKISPDFKKLVFFSEHEVWLFFLVEIKEQPQKEGDESLFLARFSEEIGDVFWYTSDYLIFNTGEKIKICETDERDKIQIWNVGEIESAKIFFNEESKRLYFQKEGNLFVTENLY